MGFPESIDRPTILNWTELNWTLLEGYSHVDWPKGIKRTRTGLQLYAGSRIHVYMHLFITTSIVSVLSLALLRSLWLCPHNLCPISRLNGRGTRHGAETLRVSPGIRQERISPSSDSSGLLLPHDPQPILYLGITAKSVISSPVAMCRGCFLSVCWYSDTFARH